MKAEIINAIAQLPASERERVSGEIDEAARLALGEAADRLTTAAAVAWDALGQVPPRYLPVGRESEGGPETQPPPAAGEAAAIWQPDDLIDAGPLDTASLIAVLDNDTATFPGAGRVEVPAAIETLRARSRQGDVAAEVALARHDLDEPADRGDRQDEEAPAPQTSGPSEASDPGPPSAAPAPDPSPDEPDPLPEKAAGVLEVLRRQGATSKAGLADVTGYPPATVTTALQTLERRGLAQPTGDKEQRRGPPSPIWAADLPASHAGAEEADDDESDPEPGAPDARAQNGLGVGEGAVPTEQLKREIREALDGGRVMTARELHDRLDLANRGVSRQGFAGRLRFLGCEQAGQDGWRLVPSIEDQGGTRRHEDVEPEGTLQGRILAALRLEPKTVPVLARELGEKPTTIAHQLALLTRESEVEKRHAGKYHAKVPAA